MVNIEIKYEQLRKAIEKLPVRQRAKLLKDLEQETWEERFKQLLERIDARRKKSPLSTKQISKIIEEARDQHHANRRR